MSLRLTFTVLALCATVAGAALAADEPAVGEPTVGDPELASPFFPVNDNSISYHYEFSATNPGAGTTGKHVLSFTHFDVWAYGTNFVNIDWLKATNGTATPAAPCGFPNADTGCSGYSELYGLWRGTLGWNQLFDTKMFGAGPLKNVAFLAGVDLNADNTTLWSRKRSIEAGVQIEFEAPYNGFLNAGFVAYKEWQHDGIASSLGTNPGGHVSFDPTWGIELNYVQPLGFLPPSIPLTYKALVSLHGSKGAGEPNAPSRIPEYYMQQTLSLDIGQVVAEKPNMVYLWGSYRWWVHKFGLNPTTTGLCCTTESTWITGITFAF